MDSTIADAPAADVVAAEDVKPNVTADAPTSTTTEAAVSSSSVSAPTPATSAAATTPAPTPIKSGLHKLRFADVGYDYRRRYEEDEDSDEDSEEESESEDEDGDEIDDDFDFSPGSVMSSRPKKATLTIQSADRGTRYKLRSRAFAWPYRWMTTEVKCRHNRRGSVYNLETALANNQYFDVVKYDLDRNDGDKGIVAISTFLRSALEELKETIPPKPRPKKEPKEQEEKKSSLQILKLNPDGTPVQEGEEEAAAKKTAEGGEVAAASQQQQGQGEKEGEEKKAEDAPLKEAKKDDENRPERPVAFEEARKKFVEYLKKLRKKHMPKQEPKKEPEEAKPAEEAKTEVTTPAEGGGDAPAVPAEGNGEQPAAAQAEGEAAKPAEGDKKAEEVTAKKAEEPEDDPTVPMEPLPKLAGLLEYLREKRSGGSAFVTDELGEACATMLGQLALTRAGAILAAFGAAPDLMREAALLFPRKIDAVLKLTAPARRVPFDGEAGWDLSLIQKLDKLVKEEPWKMAFAPKLSEVTGIPNLEVTLSPLRRSSFYSRLTDEQKHAALVYDYVKSLCFTHGFTFVEYHDLYHFNRTDGRKNKKYNEFQLEDEEVKAAADFLIDNDIAHEEITYDDSEERLILDRFQKAMHGVKADFEKVVAAHDADSASNWSDEAEVEAVLKEMADREKMAADEQQMAAARVIASKPLSIVSGGVGTGKTTVAVNVLDAIKKRRGVVDEDDEEFRVLYISPTDAAAHELRSRVPAKSGQVTTLHQILAAASHGEGGLSNGDASEGSKKGNGKFDNCSAVVFNESAMISVELFAKVLRVLQQSSDRLRKIVILGDILQLPSVEPGNFMWDVYEAFGFGACSKELKTNHKSELKLLYENAHKISNGDMPIFEKEKYFHLLVPSNYSTIAGSENLERDEEIHHRLYAFGEKTIMREKMDTYRSLLFHARKEYEIEDPINSQIVELASQASGALNEYGCKVYNNHLAFEDDDPVRTIEPGDKIMVRRNRWLQNYEYDPSSSSSGEDNQERVRVSKGEIFTIEKIEGDHLTVLGHSRRLVVSLHEFRRQTRPEHAYCLTVEQCQGAKFDTVVFGLQGKSPENWQHLYAALTRAKKRVVMVGTREELRDALKRLPNGRKTTLNEVLHDLFVSEEEAIAATKAAEEEERKQREEAERLRKEAEEAEARALAEAEAAEVEAALEASKKEEAAKKMEVEEAEAEEEAEAGEPASKKARTEEEGEKAAEESQG